ncbi:four-helix bundle copper-binding protein, partial [Streptomyces sp. SID5770]
KICDMCGQACMAMPDDPVMMRCAEACRRCAQMCRAMTAAAM